jgi:DNA polymerase I-like protein with 3'-5' exonuclease and polymerase domains
VAILHDDRERDADVVPIIAAHDEIVYKCDEGEAEGVKEWIEETMKTAMDEIVSAEGPQVTVEVEGVVNREWIKPYN